MNQIMEIIDKLAPKIGREQAIKDLQTGLNILNKTNGKAEAKIEIDGKYGVQTHAALESASKTYPAQAIRKSIKTAAISNAVFDTKDKKKIDTGRRIERIYNSFDNEPLKGGVSYYEYIWCAAGADPCEDCAALDGEVFENYEDVPDHPHPNCQCYVEMVETDKDKKDQCDCWDEIDAMVAEVEAEEGELESILDEAEEGVFEVEAEYEALQQLIAEVEALKTEVANMEPCGPDCVTITGFAIDLKDDEALSAIIQDLIQNIEEAREVLTIFEQYKAEMEAAAAGMDKYYHARANCDSATLSEVHAGWAGALSVAKELKDLVYKIFVLKQDAMKIIQDCWQDWLADKYGLEKALEHGSCSDKIKPKEIDDIILNDFWNKILEKIIRRRQLDF